MPDYSSVVWSESIENRFWSKVLKTGPVRNVARDKARALFDAFNITRKEQIR